MRILRWTSCISLPFAICINSGVKALKLEVIALKRILNITSKVKKAAIWYLWRINGYMNRSFPTDYTLIRHLGHRGRKSEGFRNDI